MKMIQNLGLVASLAVAGGCAHPGYNSANGRYYGQVDLDRSLEQSVRTQLNQYGQLAADAGNVQVSAQNGTVTLSGPVPSEQDRQMIDALARNTSGVTSVIDQMQAPLTPTGAPGQPPRVYVVPPVEVRTPMATQPLNSASGIRVQPGTADDRFTADRIADTLRSAPLPMSATDSVTATVRGPVVYVQGTVASDDERQAIRSAIEHTTGVSAVYDQLQVR
jgi:osmotically-inducible protein OsmY